MLLYNLVENCINGSYQLKLLLTVLARVRVKKVKDILVSISSVPVEKGNFLKISKSESVHLAQSMSVLPGLLPFPCCLVVFEILPELRRNIEYSGIFRSGKVNLATWLDWNGSETHQN